MNKRPTPLAAAGWLAYLDGRAVGHGSTAREALRSAREAGHPSGDAGE